MDRKRRILIADDETDLLDLMKYRFEGAGYEVLTAANGREAYDILMKEPVDLAILDIVMPGMDGRDLLTALKKHASTTRIPVIITSAKDEYYNKGPVLDLGAYDYVEKPFDDAALLRLVKKAISSTEEAKGL